MKPTLILLPTDNRPITYCFPQLICQLAGVDVLMPPRELMGSLFAPSDLSLINKWLDETVAKLKAGAILICLDTLLYGGLIPSRRGNENLETVLNKASHIIGLKKSAGHNVCLYAQSSIMRISDNYDNTEEKLYWAKYGRDIYKWSQLLHKKEIGNLYLGNELKAVEASIEIDIRQDYLNTRQRNFAVNKTLIDYVISGDIDFLIFSQDDSGRYGLNVLEKEKLLSLAKEKKTQDVLAYPGADEMLMTLIARYLNSTRDRMPKIALHYTAFEGQKIASNYEGQNIGESMINQANAQGLEIVSSDIASANIDFHVIVHTGLDIQGDHIWLPGLKDLRVVDSKNSVAKAIQLIEQAKTPIAICDIAYSNGADPLLIDQMLKYPDLFKKVWSYAGWNTTGNAVGCVLATAVACLYAKNSSDGLNDVMRKELLFIRLMDDWAYQTQVRKQIQSEKLSKQEQNDLLVQLMNACANRLVTVLDFKPSAIEYKLPWQRPFEVEINLDSSIAKAMA